MEIKFENIVLRDMKQSDIADYVRWFTTETEWMDWDAPWEKETLDADAQRESWTEYYESMQEMPDDRIHCHFEIESEGRHIGWVSSYLTDENYEWISARQVKNGQKANRTIGITVGESSIWGKHLGTNALRAFIRYYADHGCKEIYTQTWSGNVRMIHVAEKLGFQECNRVKEECEVDGQKYDSLTFMLRISEYQHGTQEWRKHRC